ncbi:MAG: SapC family protein [Fibrobacter sp.]|nr:SapC family protein [Fibrobacter sp.]
MAFCRKSQEFKLLTPFSAKFEISEKTPQTLTGFYAVSRDRVKELTDLQLRQLVQLDELELIYTHIQSVINFERYLNNSRVPSSKILFHHPLLQF